MTKKICLAEPHEDEDIIRQELITYRLRGTMLVRESVERVFFKTGNPIDNQTSTPIHNTLYSSD